MSDFKIGSGVVTEISYGDPIVYTGTGAYFPVPPPGTTHIRAKAWGAGGGGGGGTDNFGGGNGGGGGFLEVQDAPISDSDFILVIVASPGEGGIGTTSPGVSADGGAGGGRSIVFNSTTGDRIVECGSGGGGGGGNGAIGGGVETYGANGGGGGGDPSQDGSSPDNATVTEGGKGATSSAGGAGGAGTLPGDPGMILDGGQGGDGSGSPAGSNAFGGNGGGDGGAHDTDAPGGGGGGGGYYGGGGGGSGSMVPPEGGGGGGGGSSFAQFGAVQNVSSTGMIVAGSMDPEYPGAPIGNGGSAGFAPSSNGVAGEDGAVVIAFGSPQNVTSENDLVIENDAPVIVTNGDEIAQHVRSVLLICQGEWFLDLAFGTPWFTRVIGQKFSSGQVNITVRDAILSIDGVSEIVDLRSTRPTSDNRTVRITVTVKTVTGEQVEATAEI